MTTPSPAARALAAALRDARDASGQSGRAFAKSIGLRHTDLSHWETGLRIPSVETVATILGALHVKGDLRDRIMEYARVAHEQSWLTTGVNGIPQQLAGVVECERAAARITEWINRGVPGLLQTPDYSREVKRADSKQKQDIELGVMVNMGRREIITRRDPVLFTAFIDDSIFSDPPIPDAATMADQYRFLHTEAQRDNVHVHIVPSRQGWHPGWAGPFILYEFADASPVLYIEHYRTGAFLADDDDIEAYLSALERLRTIAKNATESLDLIDSIVQRIQGGAEDGYENLAKIPCQSK